MSIMKQAIVRLVVLILPCIFLCSWLSTSALVWALPTIEDLLARNERLEIPVKKSQLVLVKTPATRVSVVDPEIADVQIVDPKEILLSGKSVGQTSLIIWTEDGQTRMIDVSVKWDTVEIQKVMRMIMPNEPIEVLSIKNAVALRGQVSAIGLADQAMEIAKSFVPKVINLLDVPGSHQVLLQVKVAEVDRSFRDKSGMDLHIGDDSFVTGTLLGGLVSGDPLTATEKGTEYSVSVSDAVTQFFSWRGSNVNLFVQYLKERGLLYMLAEPNLIARSGEQASFLVGGEFPVPVTQGGASAGGITVEYKEFGIRLSFTPTVVARRTILLEVSPEVSDLNFAQSVEVGGFVIPSLITRRVQTVVKLNDGQTFAIAGLISRSKERTKRRSTPFIDIPVFGNLLRSSEFRGKETELLIMVTPHLIAPLDSGDSYQMPVDNSDDEVDLTIQETLGRAVSSKVQKQPVEHQERLKKEMAGRSSGPLVHSKSRGNKRFNKAVNEEELLLGKGVATSKR